MRLNTHDRTPRFQGVKGVKILFALCIALMYLLFLMCAIMVYYETQHVLGTLFLLLLPLFLLVIAAVPILDMNKAYIEWNESDVLIFDFYFGIQKEKKISRKDILRAEIVSGSSLKIRGYRIGSMYPYIIFRGENNRYLFKIICLPETKEFFKEYIR